MRKSLRLTVVLAALFLAGCGGGGSSGALSIPSAPTSTAAPPSQTNPNVDSNDTAGDWTSSRYDPSGSGDNTLQASITEANVGSLAPVWEFNGTVGSYSSVAISGGVVYRTEQGGNAYAINEATGAQIWNFAPPANEGFVPSPLVSRWTSLSPERHGRLLRRRRANGPRSVLISSPKWVGAADYGANSIGPIPRSLSRFAGDV